MPDIPQTKLLTYLGYEGLFGEIEKAGIALPLTYLKDPDNIDAVIREYVETLNPVETIQFSSFLNMVCQTSESEEVVELVRRELGATKLSREVPESLLFHRDNLLHLISILLDSKAEGTGQITGGGPLVYPQRYYKSLMLVNSRITVTGDKTKALLRDCLIRDFPYYYVPETSFTIYARRLKRYWHIYVEILRDLDAERRKHIERGLTQLENESGVSLDQYFRVIWQVLQWYLQMPILRRQKGQGKELKGGFDYNNINSFYIHREAFKNDSPFIKVAEHLASDIAGLRDEAHAKKKDDIPGFFRYFRTFFQHPFFRINDDTFCVIDLRFVLEGVCAGLLWQVHSTAGKDIRELKDEYGQLLERYFSFIAKKVFPNIKLTHNDEGRSDAVLELEDAIILLEFTTEYYRFSSLYNPSFELFEEDLHRLLLNQGKEDALGRGKKDVGKLVKLDRYVEELKTEKRVIPVLVTENYLGDYDALDQFDAVITAGINKLGLGQLVKHKPLLSAPTHVR